MKSTANLGLNLYEATDYVLHDSFNSDNQKLDAAVMAAHSFHKLKELTVSTAGSSVSFDLSGIDWSRWQAVHLDFLALVDGSYLLCRDGRTQLRGEAYEVADGALRQISREGDTLSLA